jgi:hypothetical protein
MSLSVPPKSKTRGGKGGVRDKISSSLLKKFLYLVLINRMPLKDADEYGAAKHPSPTRDRRAF